MSFSISREDLDLIKEVVFQEKETVEFVCLDAEENQTQQRLIFKCKVLTGPYKGRRHNISMSLKKDNEIQRVKMARWAIAFYTEDELMNGNTPLARMIGRKFTAVAQRPREWQGKTFQDMDFWKDLGEAGQDDKDTARSATSQPAQGSFTDSDLPF